MRYSEKKSVSTNFSDYTDFKNIQNGPSSFRGVFNKGEINLRVRTGHCENWNKNINNLIALNLSQHDYYIDGYAFCLYDLSLRKIFLFGWILFDELLKKADVFIENEDIYLTLPIRKLHSMESLKKEAK